MLPFQTVCLLRPVVASREAYLVVDDDVVLGSHVVCDVVVHDEPQQAVEEGQVHLLVHLLEERLHHHVALALGHVPHVLQVVDAWRGQTDRPTSEGVRTAFEGTSSQDCDGCSVTTPISYDVMGG